MWLTIFCSLAYQMRWEQRGAYGSPQLNQRSDLHQVQSTVFLLYCNPENYPQANHPTKYSKEMTSSPVQVNYILVWGLRLWQAEGEKIKQLLGRHDFKSDLMNSTKSTTNLETTVYWKLWVRKSDILDTSDTAIECVWHALCMTYCCDKVLPGLRMVKIDIIITINRI